MTRRTTRTALLARTALGVSLALLAAPALAQVSTNAGTITGYNSAAGSPTFSGANSNTGGADVSTITLDGPWTVLDWSGNLNLNSGDTLNFVFANRGDIALNRVNTGSATIDGAVNGTIGTTAGAYGGNVWFMSRDGVVFGSNARVNVGGLLATTGAITDLNFVSNSFGFTTTPGTSVYVMSGAQLNVHGGTLALIAPSVVTQSGSLINDGTAGKHSDVLYGAADAYTITFAPDAGGDLDLFSWTVPVGSGTNVTPITLAGATTAGNVYLGAVSRNAVGGTINITGSITANGAVASGDGNILLVGGGGISNGAASGLAGTTLAFTGNGAQTANRDVTVTGGGDVTLGAITGGNDVTLSSGNLLTTGTTTIGRHYTVTGKDFSGSLSPVWTGAVPHNYTITDTASGLVQGNISVSGNLSITTQNGGSLTFLGALTSTGGDVNLTTVGNGSLQIGAVNAASGSVALTSGGAITQTGAITTGTLRANGGGSVTLTNAGNAIGVLGASGHSGNFGGAGFALTDTGGLTVSGPLTSNGDLVLSNNGALVFNTPTVSTNGTATFTAPSTTFNGTTVSGSYITVNGATTFNGATMQSGGSQNYLGAVTLAGDASLTSGGPGWDILFDGAVNGAHNLTVTSKGSVHFNGAVGGTTALTSLSATGTQFGVTVKNPVTTTGAQTFNTMWMEADTTLTSTGAGAITLGRVNGPYNLNINTAGTTTIGFVGYNDYVASVTTDAPGTTVLNGTTFDVTGSATFNDAVTLGTPVRMSAGSAVTFNSTLDGTGWLMVEGTGTTTFNGAVGATTALSMLTTDASGTTVINGGSVRTSGNQTYGNSVILGADTVLTSTSNGAISLAAVNGARSLTVNTGGATSFNGAIGGATALTSLFTDALGTTALNGGSIVTTGAQTYNDAVTLGANTTVASTGSGAITLGGTVDGARSLTVNTAGTTTFNGAIGATTVLTSLTTNTGGTTLLNGGYVRTSGAQSYADSTILGADTLLSSTGAAAIGFSDALNGAYNLTVTTNGPTSFTGSAVGAVTPLASLTTNQIGTTILGGNVTTTGAQSFLDAVTLSAATITLASTGGGDVTLGKTVDGASQLTVNTSGTTKFNGAVGFSTALTSLFTDAPGTTALNGGSVTTTGAQIFGDAATLGADTTLTSTGSGMLRFSTFVNGAYGLTMNTAGSTILATVGDTTALTSLTTDAAGSTTLTGGAGVRTSGAQTFNDNVTLTGTVALTSTSNGNIRLGGTVDSANGQQGLSVTTGGDTIFSGAVGATNQLAWLWTDGGGVTRLNGGALTTSGAQTFGDAVVLGANTTLNAGASAIGFASTVDGAYGLTANTTGATTFNGAVGATTALTSLTTNAGGSTALNGGAVRTTGAQTFGDSVVLGADTTLTSTSGGDLRFGAIDGAYGLTLNTGGTTRFNGAVGATTALASLTTDAGGSTEIYGGSVHTTGDQTYNDDAIRLGADTTLTGQDLSHVSSIVGPAYNLTLDFSGAAAVHGLSLRSLRTRGAGTTTLSGSITTLGTQTYDDAVILGGDVTLNSSGAVSFNSTVDGAHDLAISSNATTTFMGAVGASTALTSLTRSGNGGSIVNGALVRTTGAQTWGGSSLSTNGDATFSGSNLTFGAINANAALSLTSTGTITASGTVGVNGDYTVSAADFAGQALNPTFTGMGDFSITDTAGGLTLGSLGTPGALTVTVLNGGLTVNGVVGAAGDVGLIADGDLTLASSGRVLGDDVRLSTDQAFVNQRGADAVNAAGRWLIYSAGPSGNIFGGLDSGNTAVWGRDISGAAVTQSGNRYVFAAAPTLTFTSTGGSKVYGNDGASVMGYSVSGLSDGVAGAFQADTLSDVVSGGPALSSAGAAERATVAGGPYQVVVSAGDLQSLAGYQFAFDSAGQIVVTPKAIGADVVADSKTYDGNANGAGSVTLTGVLAGDAVGTTDATFTFDSRNAGNGRTVTVSGVTLTGGDAGNYTLTLPASVLADIYKRQITGVVTANDKTYDGSAAGTGSVSLQGVLGADSVGTTGATFTFADRNAGADKVVTVSGVTLNGDDAGNYTLSLPASALADIARKTLSVTVVANDKTYDGTTAGTGTVSLGGVVANDAVGTSAGTYTFADRNAGLDKVVTVSGVTLTGADAGNYSVTIPASVLADIARRAVTVKADDLSKVRGDVDPALTWTLTAGSLAGGDSLTGALVRAPGENPGLYAITQGDLAASANYVLTFNPGEFEITRPAVDPSQSGGGPVLQALTQPTPPTLGGNRVSVTLDLDGGVPDGDTRKCEAGESGCKKTN
ncbi:YDG domain-containing protein [Caulobacter sp. 17J65-9]|uniref:YDG domain-containing protein n=1 Tax=Caulobacter sp. 17J65-9 TaxID=2709382 RepID=UPI0013C9D82A|nr:YDG domain-containing protein [Caulobacter sp. 17J65-9]NEX92897.1 filamentous hemagglutinin N-terminal domain-containing protein [Caulobacter sp. 17J65-9]